MSLERSVSEDEKKPLLPVAQSSEDISCCAATTNFLKSAKFKLFVSYTFSTWSDQMWSFALSIALYDISGSLRLTAISGFVNNFLVLIFGALVGRWLDREARLRAAQTCLSINNLAVALSAGALASVTHWSTELKDIWDGGLTILLIVISILLCAFGILAGTGTKICLTKDWVVVLSKGCKEELAGLNAMLVRINLISMILSPLLAGQIMTSVSISVGCLFIAAWCICSYGLEMTLLWLVYRSEPALSKKPIPDPDTFPSGTLKEESDEENQDDDQSDRSSSSSSSESPENQNTGNTEQRSKSSKPKDTNVFQNIVSAWRTYFRQSCHAAGLGLAMLYLTVMGLDGINSGYAYSQGIKENVLAAVRGVGAIVGISGSFFFPKMRSRIGLERTGLIGLTAELFALCLPLASVWLPGSPFDLTVLGHSKDNICQARNSSIDLIGAVTEDSMVLQSSTVFDYPSSMASIWAFLTGIVLARFGLWTADLAITQIMQEAVSEQERGVVFGVQSAINQLSSLLKDTIVIFLPDPETFGILIIVSFLAVLSGFVSYCVHSKSVRGHILPCHGKRKKRVENDDLENPIEVETD